MNSLLGAEWLNDIRNIVTRAHCAFSERPELVRLKWVVAVSDAIFGPVLHRKRLSDSGTISRTWSLTHYLPHSAQVASLTRK